MKKCYNKLNISIIGGLCMKVYDLTQKIENNMTVYSKEESPCIKPLFIFQKDSCNVTSLGLTSHLGTHIDVPLHIFENEKNICDFSVETFCGRGACVSFEELKNLDFSSNRMKNIDYLLIFTGWDKFWNSEKYFENYPVVSEEIILKISNSHLKGIGIDCLSPDIYNSLDNPNHKILLKNNKIIVENLCGLESIIGKEFYFSCFPLKIEIDGCPVRAVAFEIKKENR